MIKSFKKTRKGFSLVELVIAILIIAVLVAAVFAGGSIIIRNSQISRTTSDLHNFSIAVETWLNENPKLLNVMSNADYDADDDAYVKSLNALLAEDYQIAAVADGARTTNITSKQGANSKVFESVKTDAWGNHYFVVLTNEDRTGDATTAAGKATDHSDYFVMVISAGPNAKATIGEAIENDDIFLLAQNTDGDVSSQIFNYADANTTAAKLPMTNKKDSDLAAYYTYTTGGSATVDNTPVVFQVAARA